MKKSAISTIRVQGAAISILSDQDGDFISLTDMLKAKDGEFFISDWLRNRNTVEFLGIWESVYNPAFNSGEFATIHSTIEQLLVLANLESLNSEFIHMQLPPATRLIKLNGIAIRQMSILTPNPVGLLENRIKP